MPNLSIGEKARRVLDFLLGARHWKVQRALGGHGWSEGDLVEGWTRLQRLTTDRLDYQSSLVDPRLLGALDRWENRWFPVIEVVLRTHHPKAHEVVFRNLRQTDGAEVVVSVSTLLGRLDAIARPEAEGGLGEEGVAARAMLEKRGVTAAVLTEARDMLAQIGSLAEPPTQPEPESTEAAKAAEDSLWSWYLEWSAIARVAISDRRLLRSLGFLRRVRRPDGTEEDVVVTDDVDTDAPIGV